MKELLIVLGGASVVYGAYLLTQKKKGGKLQPAGTGNLGGSTPAPAVTIGPTIQSTAKMDNNISPVEQYDASYAAKFPPTTYIQIPGAGSLDQLNMQNAYQTVKF
jgi:hypothetical protein